MFSLFSPMFSQEFLSAWIVGEQSATENVKCCSEIMATRGLDGWKAKQFYGGVEQQTTLGLLYLYDEMFPYSSLRIKRYLIALYLNGAEVQRFTLWEDNHAWHERGGSNTGSGLCVRWGFIDPPPWEITYAGNADQCCVAPFLVSGLSESKRLLYLNEADSLFPPPLHHLWSHIFKQDKIFLHQLLLGDGKLSTKSLEKQEKTPKEDVYYAVKVVAAFLSHLKSERCLCIWTRLWFMHRHTQWSHSLIPPLAGTRTWWQFKTFFRKLS